MNRYIIIVLVSLILMGGAEKVNAQQRFLTADNVFAEKVGGVKTVSETVVEGKQLSKYHLTLFHSLQCSASSKGMSQIYKLIEKDVEAGAAEKDVRKDADGFKFVLLKVDDSEVQAKYLIFQRKSPKEFVLVYLEGKVSPTQLKEMFNK